MFKSYDEEFNNLFTPKIEVVSFHYIESFKKETDIQPKFAENMQINNEKQENKPLFTEITLPKKTDNSPESFSFPSIIRNVTPKRGIFRRFPK